MKTLIILEDSTKVKFGGGQKGTLEIIEALKDEFNIIVFDCSKKSIFQNRIKDMNIKRKNLKCYGKIIGGRKSSFSVGYKEVLFYPFLSIYNILNIISFMRKIDKNETLFYTSNKKHLILLYVLKKLVNIKYIYHARTYDDKNSKFYKLMEPGLKNAKRIICVSNFIKKNINLSNTITVYNPLKIDKKYEKYHFAKTITNKSVIKIATFSELLKWKGINYFIKSFDLININKKIEFHIYGSGIEKDNLVKLAANNQNIFFKGHIENVYDIMASEVDVIVSSSISPESFGRTTIEGCYFGIVPVVSNIGAQKELISNIDEKLLFKTKNISNLAKAIEYAIKNYEFLSKKAVIFSENFKYENYRRSILQIFRNVY